MDQLDKDAEASSSSQSAFQDGDGNGLEGQRTMQSVGRKGALMLDRLDSSEEKVVLAAGRQSRVVDEECDITVDDESHDQAIVVGPAVKTNAVSSKRHEPNNSLSLMQITVRFKNKK